jgi:hypothetical protein
MGVNAIIHLQMCALEFVWNVTTYQLLFPTLFTSYTLLQTKMMHKTFAWW